MKKSTARLGPYVNIRTGKLDANAQSADGQYPFFTCAVETSRIDTYSYDCECVLIAGNGDLNVKYYNGKFDAYQRTYIVESKDKQLLDVRYLFHFMSLYVATLRELSIGGVIKYIKLGNLTEAPIPLPPLEQQKRIVAILDKADELRAKRRRAIEKLDELLKSVFLEMFGAPELNLKKWDTLSLEELIKEGPQNGLYRPSSDYGTGTPIVRIDSFYSGKVTDIDQLKRVRIDSSTMERYSVKENDILINRVNSREYLGKSAIVPRLSEATVFESNMMRFSVDTSRIHPQYLTSLLQHEYMKKQILGRSKDAVNQSSINQGDVKSFEVRVPPLKVQESYVDTFQKVQLLLTQKLAAKGTSEDLFLSLQSRAFSGDLTPDALDDVLEVEAKAEQGMLF